MSVMDTVTTAIYAVLVTDDIWGVYVNTFEVC